MNTQKTSTYSYICAKLTEIGNKINSLIHVPFEVFVNTQLGKGKKIKKVLWDQRFFI